MIDWTQPVEALPEGIPFAELPPVAQALVRRNVRLRQKLHELEALLEKNPQAADFERLEGEKESLLSQSAAQQTRIKELEAKLEDFRQMLARRDDKIAKLQKKR